MKNGRENVDTPDACIKIKNRNGWYMLVFEVPNSRGRVKVHARCIKNPDLVLHAEMASENVRSFDPAAYWAEGLKIRRSA